MADATRWEQLKATLESRLPFLAGQITVRRDRRLFVETPAERTREVIEALRGELGFRQCCTITGTDDGETLGVLYHLAHDDGTLVNLRQRVPRAQPVIDSVTDIFPSCANYERELVDLLGFEVRSLPPGKRYPMPDDFPRDQHPLRKDWKPTP
jgi:NADH:ubiquinone oxidoreductase subunit C